MNKKKSKFWFLFPKSRLNYSPKGKNEKDVLDENYRKQIFEEASVSSSIKKTSKVAMGACWDISQNFKV